MRNTIQKLVPCLRPSFIQICTQKLMWCPSLVEIFVADRSTNKQTRVEQRKQRSISSTSPKIWYDLYCNFKAKAPLQREKRHKKRKKHLIHFLFSAVLLRETLRFHYTEVPFWIYIDLLMLWNSFSPHYRRTLPTDCSSAAADCLIPKAPQSHFVET